MDGSESKIIGRRVVRQSLSIYLAAICVLWTIAALVVLVRAVLLHRTYPYDTLLFDPGLRFTDFTIFYPRFAVYGVGDLFFNVPGFPFGYPAPLLIAFLSLWKLTAHPLELYLGGIAIFTGGAICFVFRKIGSVGELGALAACAVAATWISFPLVWLLDRANLEAFVWIATTLGILFFTQRRYAAAAVALGLATSMKIFPGTLVLLFLAKRRYREFWLALSLAAAFDIAALWLAGPTFSKAAGGIAAGIDFFRRTQIFTYRPGEIGFDHSLFGLVKQVTHYFVRELVRIDALIPRMYLIYAASACMAFLALYGLRIRHLPILNQILALSALSVTLPFVSYDYTLVHLYAPWSVLLIFLLRDVAGEKVRLELKVAVGLLVPFAVLFAPESYLLVKFAGLAGQVKALALVALVAAAVSFPLPSSLFGELEETGPVVHAGQKRTREYVAFSRARRVF